MVIVLGDRLSCERQSCPFHGQCDLEYRNVRSVHDYSYTTAPASESLDLVGIKLEQLTS
jgi:hypothetical protein